MGRGFSIRPYRPRDLPAALEVFRAAVRTRGPDAYPAAAVRAWLGAADNPRRFGRVLRAGATLVVRERGRLIAFGGLRPDGHLETLYVHPAHAGRGIGSRLCDILEATARGAGAGRLTTVASRIALPFFLARGFRVTAGERVRRGGVPIERFRMEKRLGDCRDDRKAPD